MFKNCRKMTRGWMPGYVQKSGHTSIMSTASKRPKNTPCRNAKSYRANLSETHKTSKCLSSILHGTMKSSAGHLYLGRSPQTADGRAKGPMRYHLFQCRTSTAVLPPPNTPICVNTLKYTKYTRCITSDTSIRQVIRFG